MPYKDPETQRRYQRERVAARRAEYFRGKVCATCGSDQRLELDHIDPMTKVSHRIWSWSAERLRVELSKCQPLCYDCHKGKSAHDQARVRFGRARAFEHGFMYGRGCRCDDCRVGNTVKKRKQRGSKPRPPLRHGTSVMYNREKCRCDSCRAYRREKYQKEKI